MIDDAEVKRVRHLCIPGYGDDEIRFIAETFERFNPEYVFEWGTNVGASARIFLEVARCRSKTLRPAIRVTTVEHPDHNTHDHPGGRYALWCDGFEPHIQMRSGDGVTVALEEFEQLGKPDLSLFFLDGDHSYAAVSRELMQVSEAAPLAVILVHDTNHPTEETEAAVEDFLECGGYDADWLASQAGMVRLWPQSA